MKTSGGYIKTEAVTENIMHVTFAAAENMPHQSLIIEAQVTGNEYKGNIESVIDVCVNEKTSGLTFTNKKTGEVLLKEKKTVLTETPVYKYTTGGEEPVVDRVKTVDGERNFIKNLKKEVDRTAYRGKIFFEFDDDEGIYGLGQGEDGIYNLRHHTQYLYQHNMRIPMPFIYSDKGYGILFDCTSLMTWEDSEVGSYIYMDCIERMDYYVIYGPDLDDVVRGVRYLTGRASMLPKWAFGYVQSREQYYTADELADVVGKYRELNVPLDVIVQDWNTWDEGNWGEKILDKSRYGNMRECADKIHEMNAHTMVSVWPNSAFGGKNHTQIYENGLMLNDLATYDAFNEEARDMYWAQARDGLYEQGFDSWWCDSTEPFSGPDWNGGEKREPWERYYIVGEEHKKYIDATKANAYALMHAKGMYDGQRRDYPDKRMLNLTRSGYAGSQKYGAVLWSGDIAARWDVLKTQIAEALNMSNSCYPYWTLDIGGFFTVREETERRGCGCSNDNTPKWFWQGEYERGVKDPAYRELYTRWIEMGVFLPMFRSHGTDTPREIWNFGKPGDMFHDTIKKYIELRYELMPTIYSAAGDVYLNNTNMLRSLLYDFRDDRRARDVTDEYMFTRSLLVCPVTEPMYYTNEYGYPLAEKKVRRCYLPKGCKWIDYHDGTVYDGGQDVEREAPIDVLPLFVRDGSILFKKYGMQHVNDKADEPVIVEIWGEHKCEASLYEDDGESYNYEVGEYSLIKFSYDNGVLVIADRVGNYTPAGITHNDINTGTPGVTTNTDVSATRVFVVRHGERTVEVEYTGHGVSVNI